jgi:hypothetical protein
MLLHPTSTDSRRALYLTLALFTGGLLVYSLTLTFTGDEGFHMLAAQLIKRGLRPYLDFCFPQTPLNAYFNSFVMRVFGENWRPVHIVASLFTVSALYLAADFFRTRCPFPAWRTPGAIAVVLLSGMNYTVTVYGSLGQAYGISLLLILAAFRVTLIAVERPSPLPAAGVGLLASAAAACSMLVAPVGPVLLIWIVYVNRAGNRWLKGVAAAAAAIVPWFPVLWLYRLGPAQTWFNIVQYHSQFRRLYWPDTTRQDIEVFFSWIDSGAALVLGILGVSGLLFIRYRSQWESARKAEFYLCFWLAAALSVEATVSHPAFQRYFIFIVPFVAILAAAGLYAIGSRVFDPERPFWPVAAVVAITAFGLAQDLYNRRDLDNWGVIEKIARRLNVVTPPGAPLYADEMLYFLTRRMPPDGLQFAYSHKVKLPAAEMAKLHIITQAELDKRLSSGTYATVYMCEDQDTYDKLGLANLYNRQEDIEGCKIFWERK